MIIILSTLCLKFELLESFGIINEDYWTDIWSGCPVWIRVNIALLPPCVVLSTILVAGVFPSYAAALLCFYERDAQGLVLGGPLPSLLPSLLPFMASSTWGSFSFILMNHGGGCQDPSQILMLSDSGQFPPTCCWPLWAWTHTAVHLSQVHPAASQTRLMGEGWATGWEGACRLRCQQIHFS